MSTPALARATEALWKFVSEETPEFEADGLDPMVIRGMETHAAVSAALHDPDDPDDWLARTLREHGETIVYSRLRCRCGWTLPSRGYAAGEARAVFSKHVADAVRAAILGAEQ